MYKYSFIVLALLVWSCNSSHQPLVATKIKATDIPASLKYQGKLVDGLQWTDKEGKNMLLLTSSGLRDSIISDSLHVTVGTLRAYHYTLDSTNAKPWWDMQEELGECELDNKLEFVENSLFVTDWDNNNIAEFMFSFKRMCRGDIGSAELQLVMCSNGTEYRIVGETLIPAGVAGPEPIGGKQSENNIPKRFADSANVYWNKFMTIASK